MRISCKSLCSQNGQLAWGQLNLSKSSFIKTIAPVGSTSSCKVMFRDADAVCADTYVLDCGRGHELAAIHDFHLKLAPLLVVGLLALAPENHLHSPRNHCSEVFQMLIELRLSVPMDTLDVLECRVRRPRPRSILVAYRPSVYLPRPEISLLSIYLALLRGVELSCKVSRFDVFSTAKLPLYRFLDVLFCR